MTKYTLKGWRQHVKRLVNSMLSTQSVPTKKAARSAAKFAKSIAPHDTGTLIQEIHWSGTKKGGAWLLQRNPGIKNPNREGLSFNYAEAMRHAGKTRMYIKTGNPDYMKVAANWATKEFGVNVRAHVTRIIKTTK